MRPEGTKTGRPVSWPVLTALFLVPLLAVGALLGLVTSNESKVTAAIVNLDGGVEIDGQPVPMGRQLAAEIMEREGENITWILADKNSGDEGILTGEYAAVVTIPENFSRAAMSFTHNDADVAEQATIDVAISDNAPVGDSPLALEITRLATESLNNMLTSQFLEGIFIGFNQVGEQFGQIVDGASQLNDGATQLADGARQAADGSSELADGARQLNEGSEPLVAGGDQLADGIYDLGDGAAQLAFGAGQLDAGVQEMAGQMPQLTGGIQQLADGAGQLLPGVADYTGGTVAALEGVGQLKGGIDQVIAGLDAGAGGDFAELQQLVDGADELATGSQQLADGIDQLYGAVEPLDGLITDDFVAAVQRAQDGAAGLGTVVGEADAALQGYASGATPLPAELVALAERLKAGFVCPVEDPAVCEQLQQAFDEGIDSSLNEGFRSGAGLASEQLNSTDPRTGLTYLELADQFGTDVSGTLGEVSSGMQQAQQLVGGVRELRDGSQQLADGNRQLADGVDQLATQLPAELESQMGQLRDGLGQISGGAGELIQQTQPLVDNAPLLASGSLELLGGIQALNSQVGGLPDGVNQLAAGTSQLSDGVRQLSDGTGQLYLGTLAYVDGVWQYTQGVGQVAGGVGELAGGIGELGDGVAQLADGTGEFASQMAAGQDEVPYYSDADRETLAEVIASPVAGSSGLLGGARASLVSLLLVSGLWLAGLAAFVVARPLPSDIVVSGAPSALLWARTVGIPAAVVAGMGLLLGVIGGALASLSVGGTAVLALLTAGLGVSFLLAQHALAGWFGHFGRGVALVLLAVTVALGLSSGVPGWLNTVAAISPLHGGLQLVRSWIAGADVVTALGVAVFVGVVMAVASWSSIAMRRQLTPAQFRLRNA